MKGIIIVIIIRDDGLVDIYGFNMVLTDAGANDHFEPRRLLATHLFKIDATKQRRNTFASAFLSLCNIFA